MPATELQTNETEQRAHRALARRQARARGLQRRARGRARGPRSDVDLHYAIGLLENGCPPEIALRILL